MDYINKLITSLLIDSLLYKNLNYSKIRPVHLTNLLIKSACQLSTCVCVCLWCLLLSVYLCVCVSIWHCVFVYRSVGGLSGGRPVCMFAFLDRSVWLWSICLCACLRASVCLYLSVYICLSICLPVCLSAVSRSVVSLSQLSEKSVCPSVSHGVHEACRQRRGGWWERERKATHTRATD